MNAVVAKEIIGTIGIGTLVVIGVLVVGIVDVVAVPSVLVYVVGLWSEVKKGLLIANEVFLDRTKMNGGRT